MCFLGLGPHNIKYIGHYNDIIMKHIALWICVSWVVERISLGICVSWVRETHFTVDMCFLCMGTPTTRDLFSRIGEHISLGICVSCVGGTYTTRDICFLCRGTHIPSDMLGILCSPTHDHISLVIMTVFPGVGEHILLGICFLGRGTHITYYIDCNASYPLNFTRYPVCLRGVLQIKTTTFDYLAH